MKTQVILLAVAIVAILLHLKFSSSSFEGFAEGTTSFNLYYADWCGHCQKVKPIFKQWAADKGSIQVNGQTVFVGMVNADAPDSKDKMAGKNVRGYPTFLLETADGKVTEYTGERSESGWMEFLKQNVK